MKHSIIPLFIPHLGCPHQCIFCNQVRITGRSTSVEADEIKKTIDSYIESGSSDRFWEAAFYGGSFTALPVPVIESLLMPAFKALKQGKIHAIRLSTRPDCINEDILQLLSTYGVTTVELGVQSLDNNILLTAERGHTAEDVVHAVSLLKKHHFIVGLQFMIGLPGEDYASLRSTARKGVALKPDFIRIYPVLALKGTVLGQMIAQKAYRPVSIHEAVVKAAFLKRWYNRHHIKVIRIGLQATEELNMGDAILGGPYHPAMGEMVDQYIAMHQIKLFIIHAEHAEIICSPRDRSKIMGQHRKSWIQYEQLVKKSIICREELSLPQGIVHVCVGENIFVVCIDENYRLKTKSY